MYKKLIVADGDGGSSGGSMSPKQNSPFRSDSPKNKEQKKSPFRSKWKDLKGENKYKLESAYSELKEGNSVLVEKDGRVINRGVIEEIKKVGEELLYCLRDFCYPADRLVKISSVEASSLYPYPWHEGDKVVYDMDRWGPFSLTDKRLEIGDKGTIVSKGENGIFFDDKHNTLGVEWEREGIGYAKVMPNTIRKIGSINKTAEKIDEYIYFISKNLSNPEEVRDKLRELDVTASIYGSNEFGWVTRIKYEDDYTTKRNEIKNLLSSYGFKQHVHTNIQPKDVEEYLKKESIEKTAELKKDTTPELQAIIDEEINNPNFNPYNNPNWFHVNDPERADYFDSKLGGYWSHIGHEEITASIKTAEDILSSATDLSKNERLPLFNYGPDELKEMFFETNDVGLRGKILTALESKGWGFVRKNHNEPLSGDNIDFVDLSEKHRGLSYAMASKKLGRDLSYLDLKIVNFIDEFGIKSIEQFKNAFLQNKNKFLPADQQWIIEHMDEIEKKYF
jgi:hypothetical protein